MNDFDSRWKQAARLAGHATEPGDSTAPQGFATRVLALRRSGRADGGSQRAGWDNWVLPLLGAMTVVLLVSALLEVPHLRGPRPLETGIENTVAQLVWSL